jgi:hypothetical protein
MKYLLKIYHLLPSHTRYGIETFLKQLIPLYSQHKYSLKLAFYSLPLLIHWILPVTFEKDPVLIKIAKRSMIIFFLYLAGILVIYEVGILLMILLSHKYNFVVGPIQFVLQTILTSLYTGVSLYYSYWIFKGKTDVEPFYLSFEKKLEDILSR